MKLGIVLQKIVLGVWVCLVLFPIELSADVVPTVSVKLDEPLDQPYTMSEDLLKLRDPFHAPEVKDVVSEKSELEQFSVDSLRLVGILTGLERIRAILQAPNGKSFFVAEKTKVGLRGGVVRKIHSDGVLIRERAVNVVGQVENIDTELKINMSGSGQGLALSKITLEGGGDSHNSVEDLNASISSLLSPKVDLDGNPIPKPTEQGK